MSNTHKYTVEILYHFTCGFCSHWWSYAVTPSTQSREIELKVRTLRIMQKLERYNELENVKEMFNFLQPEERIGNIRPNYVTEEQKKLSFLNCSQTIEY